MVYARGAAGDRDWAFVREHSPADDDYSWEWLQRHGGRNTWVLMFDDELGGEPGGFVVYQIQEGMLWIVFFFCRPGFGVRHQRALARILSLVAEQCGAASIGLRTVRPGFARVLERLGLRATAKVYAEFRFPLPASREETSHERRRQAVDDHGDSTGTAVPC